jgi:ABC-type nitrate/sulfonate/bicarbonate transport system ATPase subunit
MSAQAISISDLAIRHGDHVIMEGLNLNIEQGEFVCLVGPSGCGKSTLLRIFGDLLKPSAGTVRVLGSSVENATQRIAYVFQAARLLPWRSALSNVMLGMELRQSALPRAERHDRAMAALAAVGLSALSDRMAHALSGGEQQRVAIARALVVEPSILLMDEPFSALDVATRSRLRSEIVALWKRTGKTIVFVTHDLDEALEIASRVIVLSKKPTVLLKDVGLDLPYPRDLTSQVCAQARQSVSELFTV